MGTWSIREATSRQRWIRLRTGKSYLERAAQNLYPLELQCGTREYSVSVEERSYRSGATSRSRRTTVVVADIAIKDQLPDENDTLQVQSHLISSGYRIGGECREFNRTILLKFSKVSNKHFRICLTNQMSGNILVSDSCIYYVRIVFAYI